MNMIIAFCILGYIVTGGITLGVVDRDSPEGDTFKDSSTYNELVGLVLFLWPLFLLTMLVSRGVSSGRLDPVLNFLTHFGRYLRTGMRKTILVIKYLIWFPYSLGRLFSRKQKLPKATARIQK